MADLTSAHSLRQSPVLRPSGLIAVAIIVVAVAVLVSTGSRITLSLFAQATIISIMALAVGFLARTSDLISFGHAAPFGLGAYGAAMVFKYGMPAEAGIVVVLVAVFSLFFLIGLVVGRLNGIAFSMLTLALGQFFFVAASKMRAITSGADGMIVSLPRSLFGLSSRTFQTAHGMLIVAAVVLGALVVAIYLFEATRTGRLAIGVRENEERVRFLGYRTKILKAAIFATSAAIAALSGVLFAIYQGFVSPEILHWSFSGNALIMAILGGSLAVWGPVAGALIFFFLREWLSDITEHWHAVLGFILIGVTVAWPGGVTALAQVLRRRLTGRRGEGAQQ
ncbi:MAG: branched-chain amino acid ABC transporter permease [Rhodobiaceae bacterium]|nr:branched-chain amino acid ABC transporter permease [Rhodobiaceae bacterium]MCC0042643.1 branched-chain amino acid ABC transporter permease [Rhodobiaceae bacterium]